MRWNSFITWFGVLYPGSYWAPIWITSMVDGALAMVRRPTAKTLTPADESWCTSAVAPTARRVVANRRAFWVLALLKVRLEPVGATRPLPEATTSALPSTSTVNSPSMTET